MSGQSSRALAAWVLLPLGVAASHCGAESTTVRSLEATPAAAGESGSAGAAAAPPSVADEPSPVAEGSTERTNEEITPTNLAAPPPIATAGETSAPVPSALGDRCDVGVYDPDAPPRTLALSGS